MNIFKALRIDFISTFLKTSFIYFLSNAHSQ
nr:MAG TPA: hypothetical protein [Caudoviricetes sp.]